MKTLFFALLGTLTLTTTAFAETYECGLLHDSQGNIMYGSPAYAVDLDRTGVYLIARRVVSPTEFPTVREFRMKKVGQYPDGAIFRAAGITASIITTSINGRVVKSVSVYRRSGLQTLSANCN